MNLMYITVLVQNLSEKNGTRTNDRCDPAEVLLIVKKLTGLSLYPL